MRMVWTPLVLCLSLFAIAQDKQIIHKHSDRTTPVMVIFPKGDTVSTKKDSHHALSFLQENWETYGLAKQASNIKFKSVRESLLGKHYTFVQMLNGIPIESGDIIVSIDKDGSVYRVYNNTFPDAKAPLPVTKAFMGDEAALEMGWEHLSVVGQLTSLPKANLCYFNDNGTFKLVYRVQLQVDEPRGDWYMAVDAVDGTVHHTQNRHIYHKHGHAEESPQTPPKYDGRITDFAGELERYRTEQANLIQAKVSSATKRAQGMGKVFDPDPRTTLMDESLRDSSPASAFTDAYVDQPLNDITLENGTYSLTGPWIQIEELDPPSSPPSTTTTGVWDFTRGNFAFNEATTYFAIDRSQRELQALGFTGPTGLQEGPLRVDVNAFNGQDNSLFSSPNTLLFGAGCVDDSEDGDVILHEYGHAIQYSINQNFFGQGHGGAMGEGFGDYWASSYSISRPNGHDFNPSTVFTWDGAPCWNGRRTDKFNLVYNHNANYGAHDPISGGISDELWATPLFQSLLELYRQGIPRSEVDRIVLEAQFGLGDVQTMRLVADATVQTAQRLHPNGPHAQVFREFFANHGILDPATSFVYVAGHVPPNRSETDWKSEIQITNPNTVDANVTATVYEDSGNGFAQLSRENLVVESGKTSIFVPGGTAQRWVHFESNQPLAGTSFFQRRPSEELGTERAGVPLIGATERAADLILPHVPADRVNFWSGAVLLNPNDTAVNLTIQLIGTEGNDVSNLLNANVPMQLAARQKWVTFISEGPGGTPGIFDDSQSSEKVSYVRFMSDSGELGAFELFGYNSNSGAVATSGIIALPDQVRSIYPIRSGVNNSDFSSFSILNPTDNAVTATVKVYSHANQEMASREFTFPAKTKQLGLNLKNSNFRFPLGHANEIDLTGNDVAWMTVESDAPLRIFELAGDNARSQLDGAAVMGTSTRVVFQNPKGKLQIVQAKHRGAVTITTVKADGTSDSTTSPEMQAGENLTMDIAADAASVEVTGWLFSANVIDNDPTTGALTIVKGTQVELGQNQGKFSIANDDHGNNFASASAYTIGESRSGSLEYPGDLDFFRFEVTQSGSLELTTTGNTDTQGILYDGSMVQVSGDPSDRNIDDGGEGLNFLIQHNVTPGTYYIQVRGFQTTTGFYTLTSSMGGTKTIAAKTSKKAPVVKFKSGKISVKSK